MKQIIKLYPNIFEIDKQINELFLFLRLKSLKIIFYVLVFVIKLQFKIIN